MTAARGAEGIELYRRSGEVRAVLLDMMMPGLDGPATMRAILEINPKARIIAASGLKATGRVAEAVAEGARAFLQKPYTDEQLLGRWPKSCAPAANTSSRRRRSVGRGASRRAHRSATIPVGLVPRPLVASPRLPALC